MTENTDNKDFSFPISTLIGSSWSNFKELTRDQEVDKKYKTKYVLSMGISGILDLFRHYEDNKFKDKVTECSLTEPPVFIIGFWRSGTTLLHNVLCKNPDFGFVSTFQAIFPNHVLTQQWWLKRLAGPLVPEKRPGDGVKLDLQYPQEEEIALGNVQPLSFYSFWYFPRNFWEFVDKTLLFKGVDKKDVNNFKQAYCTLINKAMINTGGQRFMSKNPPNTLRISTLLDMYPNAKFIYIYRNPYNSISSFQRFVHPVLHGIKLQDQDKDELNRNIAKLYKIFLEKYEVDKKLIPDGQLAEIKYEDFERDKLSNIKRLYDELDLGDFKKAEPFMSDYIKSMKDHKVHDYAFSKDFIEMVNNELNGLISKWGYEVL